jgi:hypothetical protein
MRSINVLTFVTLDGVMQAPGHPDEDTSGGFRHGGWLPAHFDEFVGEEMTRNWGTSSSQRRQALRASRSSRAVLRRAAWIIAKYKRAGDVKFGSVQPPE